MQIIVEVGDCIVEYFQAVSMQAEVPDHADDYLYGAIKCLSHPDAVVEEELSVYLDRILSDGRASGAVAGSVERCVHDVGHCIDLIKGGNQWQGHYDVSLTGLIDTRTVELTLIEH